MLASFLVAIACQIHAEPATLFLHSLQQPSGGFISDQLQPGETAQPTLRTTRTALRCFRLFGAEIPHRDQVIAFHEACYDPKSGGFAAEPGAPADPISTAVALMILNELELPSDKYLERGLAFMNDQTDDFEEIRMVAPALEEFQTTVPNAKKWEAQLRSQMNADGSFGHGPQTARETALHGVAIQRLGGELDREPTLRVLRAGQRPDGGFGNESADQSDLESCYRIVRLFYRLGAQPDRVEDLRGFIARCKNDDGGYGRTPDEPSSLHGTYYATILYSWLEDLQQADLESSRRRWNFDDVPAGQLPSGWSTANTRLPATTSWQVENADGGRSLVQTATNGAYKQFNLCLSDDRRTNADVSVRLRPRTGEIDRGGGLVWRYVDPRNYYVARWNPLEDNLRLYKVVDGARSQLDTAKAPHSDDWRTLRIVAYGRNIRGYLDGELLIEAEDDQFAQPGLIGFWTKADGVTEFDDLEITAPLATSVEELPTPSAQ